MHPDQLRIALAVSIWLASSIIVGPYLYFFGRLVSHLKLSHPDLWRSLKRRSGLKRDSLAEAGAAWNDPYFIYTNEPFAKLDWPSLPQYGLIEGKNEAFDQEGTLVYSFINRVLIARRPVV